VKRLVFTVVALLLWIVFLMAIFFDDIVLFVYFIKERDKVISDQMLNYENLYLSGDDHAIYNNSTIHVSSSFTLSGDSLLEIYNSKIVITPFYDNLFEMDIKDNSRMVIRNCEVTTSEGSVQYCKIYDHASVEVIDVQNDGLNYILSDSSEIKIYKSVSDISISAGAKPDILIDRSPYISLLYVLDSAEKVSDIPANEFVEEYNNELFGHLEINKSFIQSVGFMIGSSVNLTVKDCNAVELIWKNESQNEILVEGFKQQMYKDKYFEFGESKVLLLNSRVVRSVINNDGGGELIIRDSDLTTASVSGDGILSGERLRVDYLVISDESAAILYDSAVSVLADIADRANLFIENSEVSDYTFSRRVSDFYFYIDGEKSNKR